MKIHIKIFKKYLQNRLSKKKICTNAHGQKGHYSSEIKHHIDSWKNIGGTKRIYKEMLTDNPVLFGGNPTFHNVGDKSKPT